MTKKVIDPQPIINELAQRCLKAKGMECSLLGEVIDMLKAAKPVHNAPYWATEEAFKHGYEKGYEAGKPKWIPVSERLPELIPCKAGTAYSEAVIVWTDGRKAMIAVWDGIDFLCAADYWEAWGENITHWMPLPEPPKEE